MGRYAESAEQARHAAQLDPASASAWLQVARAERALHHPKETMAAILRIADVMPDSAELQAAIGFGYINLSRMGDAVRPLERAARLVPRDFLVQSQLGFCLYAV